MNLGWPRQQQQSPGLSLSFESPVALFSTPVANLLFCGSKLLTTGNFTLSINGKSGKLGCYGLRPLMTALISTFVFFIVCYRQSNIQTVIKSIDMTSITEDVRSKAWIMSDHTYMKGIFQVVVIILSETYGFFISLITN